MRRGRFLIRNIIIFWIIILIFVQFCHCAKEELILPKIENLQTDQKHYNPDSIIFVLPVYTNILTQYRDSRFCSDRYLIVHNWIATDTTDNVSLIIKTYLSEPNTIFETAIDDNVINIIELNGFPNGECGAYIVPINFIGYGMWISVEADYSNSDTPEPHNNITFINISEKYSETLYQTENRPFSWEKTGDSFVGLKMIVDDEGYNKLCN